MMINGNSRALPTIEVVPNGIERVGQWMGRFASRLVLAVGSIFLMAAAVDLVRSDLASFEKVVMTLFTTLEANGLDRQMDGAKTREERVAVLKTVASQMRDARETLATFHARTPDVGKVSKQLMTAFDDMGIAMSQMAAAVEKDDQDGLMLTGQTLMEAQAKWSDAEAALVAIAKKVGYTLTTVMAKK